MRYIVSLAGAILAVSIAVVADGRVAAPMSEGEQLALTGGGKKGNCRDSERGDPCFLTFDVECPASQGICDQYGNDGGMNHGANCQEHVKYHRPVVCRKLDGDDKCCSDEVPPINVDCYTHGPCTCIWYPNIVRYKCESSRETTDTKKRGFCKRINCITKEPVD